MMFASINNNFYSFMIGLFVFVKYIILHDYIRYGTFNNICLNVVIYVCIISIVSYYNSHNILFLLGS